MNYNFKRKLSMLFLSTTLLSANVSPIIVLANEKDEAAHPTTEAAQVTEETSAESTETEASGEVTEVPVEPTVPVEPVQPEEQPSQPEEKPEVPEETPETKPEEKPEEKPEQPSKPEEKPEKPSKPEEKPSQPAKPEEKPSVPSQPTAPSQPQAPARPQVTPVAPAYPQGNQVVTPLPGLSQDLLVEEGSVKVTPNRDTHEFLKEITLPSYQLAKEYELFTSVMLAQAILESASGNSDLAAPGNFNLFGIKGTHEGKGVSFLTHEDDGRGNLYTITSVFRKYENYHDSLEDYAKLLKTDFYKGAWRTKDNTYEDVTAFLTGRYATDTSYAKKLNGLIEAYELDRFDDMDLTDKEVLKIVEDIEIDDKDWGYPLEEKATTVSGYEWRLDPFTGHADFHTGLDLPMPTGTRVLAARNGIVIQAADMGDSYGNSVIIQHPTGLLTRYAHMDKLSVKKGDTVSRGQMIGTVGSTGRSTGSHLHFELLNGKEGLYKGHMNPNLIIEK
ncbi:peptidoglycan DD-metalloendopeptidase family protein [Vagococcus lutrae]|uniref:peptidoglycan DD-metalloendopeptidase family protein n=1 Tax=Vagococcus lutrae TaxID=81947 RepID=UPI0023A9A617|nr:peptidoglycan DD-metalloendopeptidase family protein [Vagococcus lutrae]